jgi:CBS domain-containing protein
MDRTYGKSERKGVDPMNVRDLMQSKVQTVMKGDTVRKAAGKLADKDIGMLPVIGENNQVVGTLTDRDIVINGIASGKISPDTKVEELMSPNAVTCAPDTSLDAAAEIMQSHRIRRLIVADEGGPVGVVSIGDIANQSKDPKLISKTLAEVS